jgi:hypothetical protein
MASDFNDLFEIQRRQNQAAIYTDYIFLTYRWDRDRICTFWQKNHVMQYYI